MGTLDLMQSKLILRPGDNMMFASTSTSVERIYYKASCPKGKLLPISGGWQVRNKTTLLRLLRESRVQFFLERIY
jgi:hypothetical protein